MFALFVALCKSSSSVMFICSLGHSITPFYPLSKAANFNLHNNVDGARFSLKKEFLVIWPMSFNRERLSLFKAVDYGDQS